MQTPDQHEPARAEQSNHAEHVDVLVIGAGQAGLAIGWHLREQGIRSFLLIDGGPEVGHVWRNRWDSLRLFTPAEYDALPGMPFPAPAGTYPTKDQVSHYLRGYAAAFDLPVRLNTRLTRLSKTGDTFHADTATGPITARQVVIATGPFQTPTVPTMARNLAADVVQVHSADYRNPDQLPDGPVLVVGAGNSGLQIACELAATRPVTVAVGTRSPMLPQRMLGRDLFWWLSRLGLLTKTADSRLARRVQNKGDLVIGTRWRDLSRLGVQVRPRLEDIDLTRAMFADGTSTEVAAVVWATGFRTDYSWLDIPGAVVDGAVPHERGLTPVPGLSILGLPWLHTRGSALLGFVKDDAAWLGVEVARQASAARPAALSDHVLI
jgi:putative flavoprotein involved in K+ transport